LQAPPVGEVIVDGGTVTKPLEEALRTGMVDVTLVISGLQAEMSLMPNATVSGWKTANDFNFFCMQQFQRYPKGTASGIQQMYIKESLQSPALAYYSLLSDVGVSCGFQQLAVEAGQGFRHPVYLMYADQGPAAPFPMAVFGNRKLIFPFHAWDFICGFGLWDFFSGGSYQGQSEDLALGKKIRQAWFDIMQTGKISTASKCGSVNQPATFPNNSATCIVNTQAR